MSGVSCHRIQVRMRIILLLMAVLSTGCAEEFRAPWETVYPAKGLLHHQGRPLAGAQITLIPEEDYIPEHVRPSATTKDDGTFELGTYSNADGAPAGDYKVLVLHYPVTGPKESPSPGPNDLPPRYARRETTPLKLSVSAEGAPLPPLDIP